MRLGGQPCKLKPGSRVHATYQKDVIIERHRHRYEFNNTYMMELESAGLRIAGRSMDGNLVEIVEYRDPAPLCHQILGQVGPDETRNARD